MLASGNEFSTYIILVCKLYYKYIFERVYTYYFQYNITYDNKLFNYSSDSIENVSMNQFKLIPTNKHIIFLLYGYII